MRLPLAPQIIKQNIPLRLERPFCECSNVCDASWTLWWCESISLHALFSYHDVCLNSLFHFGIDLNTLQEGHYLTILESKFGDLQWMICYASLHQNYPRTQHAKGCIHGFYTCKMNTCFHIHFGCTDGQAKVSDYCGIGRSPPKRIKVWHVKFNRWDWY